MVVEVEEVVAAAAVVRVVCCCWCCEERILLCCYLLAVHVNAGMRACAVRSAEDRRESPR